MLGWLQWPEGEGSPKPPDFVLLFCAFSKILSGLSRRELPAATYLAVSAKSADAVGRAVLGAGTRSPQPGKDPCPARHYVPSKGSLEGQKSLPILPRRATAVIRF